jgi:hypothetical protein
MVLECGLDEGTTRLAGDWILGRARSYRTQGRQVLGGIELEVAVLDRWCGLDQAKHEQGSDPGGSPGIDA